LSLTSIYRTCRWHLRTVRLRAG